MSHRVCAGSAFLLLFFHSILSGGQCCLSLAEWKAFHEKEVSKWSRKAGLPVSAVRSLLDATAGEGDEEDQYLVENIDAVRLAKRHHTLVSTYALGTGHCMKVYVVEKQGGDYKPVWQISSITGISNLCTESILGAATARATPRGSIVIKFPLRTGDSPGMRDSGGKSELVAARFEWDGKEYEPKEVQRFRSYKWGSSDWMARKGTR